MKIIFASHIIAPGELEGVRGLNVNGEQVIDETSFFRAVAATHYARGNAKKEISFTVVREHASIRLAEEFVFMHRDRLPEEGDAVITCGSPGDEQQIALLGAVLAPTQASYEGVSTSVTYALIGGIFQTDSIPDGEEIDPEVTRRGIDPIDSGVLTHTVTFLNVMTGTPVVTCNVMAPVGGDGIFSWPIDGSVTAAGFEVGLSGPTPNADYKLSYIAVL